MKVTFTTTVLKDQTKNATGLPVPAEAVAALGNQKKPAVKVSIGDYSYRTTMGIVFGDQFMLPLSAANREAAGVQAGDEVEVTMELDQEPRTVEVPADLAAALAAAGAREAFDALNFSSRKEFVRQMEEAKAQETRDRRSANIVTKVSEKKKV